MDEIDIKTQKNKIEYKRYLRKHGTMKNKGFFDI